MNCWAAPTTTAAARNLLQSPKFIKNAARPDERKGVLFCFPLAFCGLQLRGVLRCNFVAGGRLASIKPNADRR
jgi:hypothetical protein